MGAWIEIFFVFGFIGKLATSHSSWVRGLKFFYFYSPIAVTMVALFMGAWIEI